MNSTLNMSASDYPIRLPTLQDLIDEQSRQNYSYPNSPENLQHVIDLLTEIPEFYIYSIQREGTPDFEIPYSIYGDIVFYLRYLVQKKEHEIIKRIFNFLNRMLESNDKYTQDLLSGGVLENFHLIIDILPDLLPYMSERIKAYFSDIK